MKGVIEKVKRFIWAIVTAVFIGATAVVSQCTQLISPAPPSIVATTPAPAPVAKKVAKAKPARKVVKPRAKLVRKCYDDTLRFLGSDRICWTEEEKK